MYLPTHFAESRPEVLQRLVSTHPFGLLVTRGADDIAANSVPFFLDADPAGGPGILRAHVARANPLWHEARGDVDSLVVFQGAQTYVSPAWYPSKLEHGKAVPTWNYVMVQGRGRLRAIDDAVWLRAFVSRLTEHHESARVEQSPAQPKAWAVTDAPADYIDTMLRAIVGLEIVLTSLVGKWKVSQNRPAGDREGVVRGLADVSGSDAAAMAHEVSEPGHDR